MTAKEDKFVKQLAHTYQRLCAALHTNPKIGDAKPPVGDALPGKWTKEFPWIGQYIREEDGSVRTATSLREWALWLEGGRNRLAYDDLGNGVRVSTIFIGLDPDHFDAAIGEPLTYQPRLWETMEFRGNEIVEQDRFASESAAMERHRELVQLLREKTQ